MYAPRAVLVGLAGDGCGGVCRGCWLWRADLDYFCRRLTRDTILGGCDLDEPGAGYLQADCAGGGALVGVLVGGGFAGAVRGSDGS